jgi:hypothetical protein
MPPNCSVDAVWEVKSFGSFDPDATAEMRAAPPPAAAAPDRSATRGNGNPSAATQPSKVQKAPPKQFSKPAEKPAEKPEESATAETALRVPFGRGPKDRAFREERQEKERHAKAKHVHRGKRGRR